MDPMMMADAPEMPPAPTPIRPDLVIPPMGGPGFDPEPVYPAWLYRIDPNTGERELSPPPEPREDQLKDWAQNDAMLYGERNRRFLKDLRLYRQLNIGVGNQFNPDTDDVFISSEAAIQINKVAAMISQSPHRIAYPWRTTQEREAASRMEAFALWFVESWMLHHRNGTGDLKWDLAWYALIYGRTVTQVGCDLDDGDFPWWVEVHDPATCFPVYGKGKHGLIRMTRRYTATTGDILDELDPTGEKGLAKDLGATKNTRRKGNDLDLTQDRQVEEIHTRWHRWMAVDGITVELTAHEYGIVPFSERLAPGEAGTASAQDLTDTGLSVSDIKRRGYSVEGSSSRQRDAAEKGQSFFHAIRYALAQREKLLGLSMIAAEQAVNPATVDTIQQGQKTPPGLNLTPGSRNTRFNGQTSAPAIPSPRPFDASTILAQLNTEIAKGLLPDVIFGQTEGSNITGFASDSLIAAAKDRIGPYFGVVQDAIGDTISIATIIFRNHGHLVEGLPGGELIIPRVNRGAGFPGGAKPAQVPSWAQGIMQKVITGLAGPAMPGMPPLPPGNSPMIGMPGFVAPEWTLPGGMPPGDAPLIRIDRETIDAVAARPQVSLETLGLNNRTVLINYLSQAVQAKLMPRSLAMAQLPEIQDTLEAYRQILAEDAQTDPEMLRLIYYPRSLAQQGDVEGYLTYWATVLLPAIQQSLMGTPAGGVPPGSPPGLPGPAPGGGGTAPIQQPTPQNAASGVNPAALGMGPGSQGGPVGRPG